MIILNYFFRRGKHFYNYRKARKLSRKINKNDFVNDGALISYLRKIDPFVFEELLLFTYKKRGYRIYRNKRYTGDGGIDGKVKIDGQVYFLQAKRYQQYINLQHVKDFNTLCRCFNKYGFFIHTGKTGKASAEISRNQYSNIQIISGQKLIDLLKYKK